MKPLKKIMLIFTFLMMCNLRLVLHTFPSFRLVELPEIAIVGRSNAGKSSVLNCIFNRKKLAFTAKEPGKTRLLNFFSVRYNGKPRREWLIYQDMAMQK